VRLLDFHNNVHSMQYSGMAGLSSQLSYLAWLAGDAVYGHLWSVRVRACTLRCRRNKWLL